MLLTKLEVFKNLIFKLKKKKKKKKKKNEKKKIEVLI